MKICNLQKYWLVFLFVKIFYMMFAIFIYSKISTLGDTFRWMDGNIENFDIFILIDSTMFIDFFGGISSILLGEIFGNIPFLFLSFYGIYYSVNKIQMTNKQLLILLILLSLPSFGIWSSIAGKESISVFFMAIIAGYIFDNIDYNRFNPKIIEIIAFYLMLLFKPQYSVAIFSVILYIYLSKKLSLKGYSKFFLIFLMIFISIIGLYIFKDVLNEISFLLPNHFSPESGSTRENDIWINDYDIFFNAPYGIFIAFWGPTFNEVINKPIQSIVFIESFAIVSLFYYFVIKIIIKIVISRKINIFMFSILFLVCFWLLFVHYPFGVLNPGSALRYRENFYGFLVVFIFYLNNKYLVNKI